MVVPVIIKQDAPIQIPRVIRALLCQLFDLPILNCAVAPDCVIRKFGDRHARLSEDGAIRASGHSSNLRQRVQYFSDDSAEPPAESIDRWLSSWPGEKVSRGKGLATRSESALALVNRLGLSVELLADGGQR